MCSRSTNAIAIALAAACAGLAQPPRQQQGPPPGSLSVRESGSSLGKIRLGASDPLWFNWQIGIPAAALRQSTFVDAAARADALSLGSVEGFSTQNVSYEVPKRLDYRLQPGERNAVIYRLRELNVRMPAYHVEKITAGEEGRKTFEFAKALGATTIIGPADASGLAEIETLAGEFDLRVAIENRDVAEAVRARGKRIGLSADSAAWIRAGLKPDDRVYAIRITDKSMAGVSDFMLAAFRAELKPLFISIDLPVADLAKGIGDFEKALLPAMTARVKQVVDLPHGKIRGPDKLAPDMRAKIEAAVPAKPLAAPKKPRKLLVVDLNMWSGHGTIPHGNWLLELFSKKLGIFDATFSNDLDNLKWDKIRQYDAVFLNNVVGMVFPDPEVREGLLRFVREGGGLGGVHGTTYAALDWPEFSDMLGGVAGAHHTEKQVLKVDDPSSPLNALFKTSSFEHTDEFYHFPASSPYSRDKLRVLLSIDVEKSDLATGNRLCKECTRPDHDYGMSWIRSYGKGRVFCTPLGHTPILFTDPAWVHHLLGGVQFILGDLDLDTTPSAKAAKPKK